MRWILFGIRRICVESLAWTESGHEDVRCARVRSRQIYLSSGYPRDAPWFCRFWVFGEVFHVEQFTLLYVQYCELLENEALTAKWSGGEDLPFQFSSLFRVIGGPAAGFC